MQRVKILNLEPGDKFLSGDNWYEMLPGEPVESFGHYWRYATRAADGVRVGFRVGAKVTRILPSQEPVRA